jgi:hypothetical protein
LEERELVGRGGEAGITTRPSSVQDPTLDTGEAGIKLGKSRTKTED